MSHLIDKLSYFTKKRENPFLATTGETHSTENA